MFLQISAFSFLCLLCGFKRTCYLTMKVTLQIKPRLNKYVTLEKGLPVNPIIKKSGNAHNI